MATVAKPPRKADQLLEALSKKYEDRASDREARSSGRTTPSKRTPRGSHERLFSGGKQTESTENLASSLRTTPASPLRSEAFSPSADSHRSRSGGVRASPGLFDRNATPTRRVSPISSPGLFERARSSPSAVRQSSSPLFRERSPSLEPASDLTITSDHDAQRGNSSPGYQTFIPRSSTPTDKNGRSTFFSRSKSPASNELNGTERTFNSEAELSRRMEGDENSLGEPKGQTHNHLSAENIPAKDTSEHSLPEQRHQLQRVHSIPDSEAPKTLSERVMLFDKRNSSRTDRPARKRLSSDKLSSTLGSTLDKSLDQQTEPAQPENASGVESRRSSVSTYSTFTQPIATASPRSSINSPLPTKSYAFEKEQTESQLRKLELENSSLKLENKSLKDKHNRAQSQIVQLETKLKTTENELRRLSSEKKKELSMSRKKNQDDEESLVDSAREKSDDLQRKIELLKVENESLEKELAAARKMTETVIQSTDITKIMDGYKAESGLLREELKKIKLLLKQSDKGLEDEIEAKRRVLEENYKVKEMNNILRQQLEMDSGGAVADKQVKGIESRLKITEDRLYQERADRAAKLSEVEDKLLNENSKLQIQVKDLSRQLTREREKLRVNEAKLSEIKEHQMSLSFLSPSGAGSRRYTPISQRSGLDGSKKFSPEVMQILDAVQKDCDMPLTQEEDIIRFLYTKQQAVLKQLNDWKNELQQLKDLQRQSLTQGENRKVQEELIDAVERNQEMDAILNAEISKLVKEKHDAVASTKTYQDKLEAAEAELEYLRIQVKVGDGSSSSGGLFSQEHKSGQYIELEAQINKLNAKVAQLERNLQLSQNELASVQAQLEAKAMSLDKAVIELGSLRRERSSEETELDKQHRKAEQLTAEVKGLCSELSTLKEKNKVLMQSKLDLELKVEELASELEDERHNLLNQSRTQELTSNQHAQLEQDLREKCEEIKVLRERYNDLENKHMNTREEAIHYQEQIASLNKQVESLQEQLVKKSVEYAEVNSRLHSQESSFSTAEERLLNTHKEIDQLRTTLSVEQLALTKLRSESEREVAHLRHENGKLSRELQALSDNAEGLKNQKGELNKDVEVYKVKMAELQARLAETQSDTVSHKEKEKMLAEERDRLTEEKHEAKLLAARIDADHKQEIQELARTIQQLRHEAKEMKTSLEAAQTNMGFENKRVTTELESARKSMAKKEKEIERLNELVNQNRQELDVRSNKVKELESQMDEMNYKNKQKIEELNAAIRQRDHQITSYERSIKDLDGESRTKKELEVKVRQLEHELEEKKVLEMRLRAEAALSHDQHNKDKDQIDKLKGSLASMEEQKQKETNHLKQVAEKAHDEIKHQRVLYDNEKTTLHDRLSQVTSDLRASEATIAVITESRQSYQLANTALERKLEAIKIQLQESQVTEKLAQQMVASVKEQLEEARSRVTKSEERLSDIQSDIVRMESELKLERDKHLYLRNEKADMESIKNSHEMKVEMLQKEAEHLRMEVTSLREQLEGQKEIGENRIKKQGQQLKSQLETIEKERNRLQITTQELTHNLERSKEQITTRNEEVQKLRQSIAMLEERLSDAQSKLHHTQGSLVSQDEMQEKLNKRNLDLELELNELKNLLSRMEGNSASQHTTDSSKIDNLTRAELNRTMTEWSVRLQTLLETERNKMKAGEQSANNLEQSKLRTAELEGKLKHEQLMHQVTKNLLKSVEEENTRLRKKMLVPKRKDGHSGKTKAELVQEKIMESELRVASQLGMTATLVSSPKKGFGLSSMKAASALANQLGRSPSPTALLDSLGFRSPNNERLNNARSPNSFDGDTSQD